MTTLARPAPPERFPVGFSVRVRADVRRFDADLLVGGSPLRAVRLTGPGRSLLDADRGVLRVHDATSATLAAQLLDGNIADPVPDGPGVDPTELTVVVPVRERAEQLDRILRPLRGLSVVVVDDDSRDPSALADVASRHGARLLRLPVNVGPAGARNAGLAEVSSAYVAFVDSDVSVEAGTLCRLCRHFADESVTLAGPLVRSFARAASPQWFERFDEQVSSLALGTRACSVRPGAAVAWLPSACLVARTDRLREVGGFAEDMRVGEDVDLVWRLVADGHRVRYDPGEVALHDTRTTVRDWLGRKFVYGTGGAALAKRHGRNGAPAVMSATMAVAAAAALARRPWSVPVVAAGLAVAMRNLHRRLPPSDHRRRLVVRLGLQGLWWAIRQEAALLLRHWWPAFAVAAVRSRVLRRAYVSALLVDLVVARIDHPTARYAPVSRRLDDLAYGAGLWVGALRARSVACLLPRRPTAR